MSRVSADAVYEECDCGGQMHRARTGRELDIKASELRLPWLETEKLKSNEPPYPPEPIASGVPRCRAACTRSALHDPLRKAWVIFQMRL